MVNSAPGLYVGTIRHRRFSPRPHEFTYSLFMALLDIDRLPEAMAVSRLTSYNRWNWVAFHDRDHLGDPGRSLRERLRADAAAAGTSLPDGRILLLTHLRYAGYVFNPISLFYCHDRSGELCTVLAEVNNTYGGRHAYWLSPERHVGGPFRAMVPKSLYVSPFMHAANDYEFVLTPPGPTLMAHMNVTPSESRSARLFDATLQLQYQPWTASTIRAALMRFPLMTAKVIAAIHFEALRLYVKGVPVVPRLVPSGVGERQAHVRGD